MTYQITDLNSWPLRSNGEPIFQNSDDAVFYAQLIYKSKSKQDLLSTYRNQTFRALKHLRGQEEPDLDKMFDLACRAQFFRESLEEVRRIMDEKSNTILNGPLLAGAKKHDR